MLDTELTILFTIREWQTKEDDQNIGGQAVAEVHMFGGMKTGSVGAVRIIRSSGFYILVFIYLEGEGFLRLIFFIEVWEAVAKSPSAIPRQPSLPFSN